MTRRCVTHHHACDCREEKFAQLEAKNNELRKAITEAHKLWRNGGNLVGVMRKLGEVADP